MASKFCGKILIIVLAFVIIICSVLPSEAFTIAYLSDVPAASALAGDSPGPALEVPDTVIARGVNGLYFDGSGKGYYLKDGRVDTETTRLVRYKDGRFYYIKGGVWQSGATQLFKAASGTYYFVENGVWKSGAHRLFKAASGTYYYVKNGIWQQKATQFFRGGSGTYYFVENGVWNRGAHRLFKAASGTYYYVKDGVWQQKATQFFQGASGTYYFVEKGVWNRSARRIFKAASATSYVVDNGVWAKNFTGLFTSASDGRAYYFVKGVWQKNAELLYKGKDGNTYYVKNGYWQKDAELVYTGPTGSFYVKGGVLQSGYTGIYIDKNGNEWAVSGGKAEPGTESGKTLMRARAMVDSVTTPDMTKEQKLKACFEHLKNNVRECSPRKPHYRGMDWPVLYANDIFVDGGSNCFGFGAAFAYMAKAIGYEEVYACNSGGHGWAEVDGLVYDPEWSRHSNKYVYYALGYDDPSDVNYKGAMQGSDKPGYQWKRVKI